jgi:predicted outer membrane protein
MIMGPRRVLIVCGIAALWPLTACAGYTPTPTADTAALAELASETPFPAAEPSESAPPAEEEEDTGTWQTKWGPLSELDRDLIRKVRLAGLWEMPMAQDAVQRATSAKVRQVSETIASQHHTLDEQVREVASKLEVKLPVKPTEQQQRWMSDISGSTGSSYDATYVKWLRLAHGQVFGLIGKVRGSTQNTLVRRFAEQCNEAVLNHQRLLESTGLTTPESFPDPAA